MAAEQRFLLEALVFAYDTVVHAFGTLKSITSERLESIASATPPERTAIFSAAWTIVDNVHAARCLFQRLVSGSVGPCSAAFVEAAAIATLQRNKMDHLHQMVGNLSNQKGRQFPIFGSVSYLLVLPQDLESANPPSTPQSVRAVTMMAGSVLGGQTAPVVNPVGLTCSVPVSNFRFSAFGETLNIDDLASRMHEVMLSLDAQTERMIADTIEEQARTGGYSAEEVRAHHGGGLTIILEFQSKPLPLASTDATSS